MICAHRTRLESTLSIMVPASVPVGTDAHGHPTAIMLQRAMPQPLQPRWLVRAAAAGAFLSGLRASDGLAGPGRSNRPGCGRAVMDSVDFVLPDSAELVAGI